MKCANCGKEIRDDNWTKYCAECVESTRTYKPTPEQAERMNEAMKKINKVLEKVFE